MSPVFRFAVVALCLTGCRSDSRLCGRMETLCGISRHDCGVFIDDMRDSADDEAVEDLKTCFLASKTCEEAVGCMGGLGPKGVTERAGEFFDGVKLGPGEK